MFEAYMLNYIGEKLAHWGTFVLIIAKSEVSELQRI